MAKVVRYTRKPDRPARQVSTFRTMRERGVLKELKHHVFNNETRWSGTLEDNYRFGDIDPAEAGRCEFFRTWYGVRQAGHDLYRVKPLDCTDCPSKGKTCPRFGDRFEESETRKLMLKLPAKSKKKGGGTC